MTKTHELPKALKDKIKTEAETIARLDAQIKEIDARLKDLVSAYILGAGLPQENIRFNDNFDLVFGEAETPTTAPKVEEYEAVEEAQPTNPFIR